MFSTFSTHAPWRKWKQTLENNMKEHVWYAVTTDNFFFIRSLLNLQHETKKQKSVKVALLCKQRKSHWDGIQETQCKPKEETVTSVSTPTAHLDECAGPWTEGLALPAVSWLDSAWGSLLHVICPTIFSASTGSIQKAPQWKCLLSVSISKWLWCQKLKAIVDENIYHNWSP